MFRIEHIDLARTCQMTAPDAATRARLDRMRTGLGDLTKGCGKGKNAPCNEAIMRHIA